MSYLLYKTNREPNKTSKNHRQVHTTRHQTLLPNLFKPTRGLRNDCMGLLPVVHKINRRLCNQEKQLERFPTPSTSRLNHGNPINIKFKQRKLNKKHIGTISVCSSKNNTLLTLSGVGGRTLPSGWASAGSVGFKNSRKSTTYASQAAAKALLLRAKQQGIRALHVKLQGTGRAKGAVVRTLRQSSVKILVIKECTPAVHNGCRPPKIRRI